MPRWAIDITAGTGGFEAATKRIPASTKKATDKATKVHRSAAQKSAQAWSTALKAVGIGALFVGAASAVNSLSHEVIDLRNEMGDMSTRTGVAAETLRTLKFASEASGQEFSGLVRVMQQIPKRMADADAGSTRVKQAFKNLGVETKTVGGEFRDADDVFKDIIVGLDKIDNKTEKAARSMDLLGRKGGDLVVAVGGGADQFERMVEFTERWGADVGPEAIATAAEMQVGYASLDLVLEGVKDQIGGMIIESDALKASAGVIVFWATLVEASFESVGDSIDGLAFAWQKLKEGDFEGVLRGIEEVNGPAGSVADGFWDASKALVQFGEDWDGIMDGLDGPLRGGGAADGSDTAGGKIAKGLEEASRIGRASVEDLLSERAKVNLSFEDTKNKLLDIMDLHGDESEAGVAAANAVVAANGLRLRQLDAIDEKERQMAADRAEALDAERQKQLAEDRAAADERIAMERRVSDAKLSIASYSADALLMLSDLIAQGDEEGGKKGVAAAKVAGVAKVVVDAAGAVMGSWDAYADIPFVGPILAGAQSALIAGIAGVQSAKIASAYQGLDLSYASSTGTTVPITMHPGERARVETRSEVERGTRGGTETVPEVMLDGRPIGRSWVRQVRRGGIEAKEVRARAGRLGHKRYT